MTSSVSDYRPGGSALEPVRRRPRWLIPAVIGGIVLLLLVMVFSSYNGLVRKDTAVDEKFANIDVQLQRRFDLIPNLATSVKAAIKQEQAVFGEIARARTQYGGARTPDQKVTAANQLDGALSRLLVVVEQYPQLKSNDTIQNLMVQIEGTENRIARERQLYNEAVRDYNTSVRTFPRSLFAGMFGFERKTPFVATPGSETPPQVNLDTSPSPAG